MSRRVSTSLALLVLSAAVLAGCVQEGVTPAATLAPALNPAPAVKADGAVLTQVGDATLATWTGTIRTTGPVAPLNTLDGVARGPSVLFFDVTLPREVTLVNGWVNWTDEGAAVAFRLLNEDGRSVCGAPRPTAEGSAECFATLAAERKGDVDWRVRLSATAPPPAREVEYNLTILFSSMALPFLGPPAPFGEGAPLRFDPTVRVSEEAEARTAEPSIALTPKGTVYVAAPTGPQGTLWRSDDGKTFTPIVIHGNPTDPGSMYPMGGGDSDVAVVGEDTLYFTDQHLGEAVSSSHDGGKTWFTNPFGNGAVPLNDRQWLVADGERTVWLAFNSLDGATVSKSLDGGKTWVLRTTMPEDDCFRGNLARAPDGTLYYAGCNEEGPGVGVSKDGGLTFTWTNVAKRSGETTTSFIFPAHIFVVVTTDAAGNAYVVWSDEAQTSEATGAPPGPVQGLNVWMASSKDQGATWSKPKKVNQAPGTYVLPWATAGADGKLAVAYYGTKFAGHPERALGEWYPILAVTEDALADEPAWNEAAVTDRWNQYGPICMRGSGCGNARNLLDFFQIQADAQGHVHMAYTDGSLGGTFFEAYIHYVRQVGGVNVGGPSVDKNGGPDAGARLAPAPAGLAPRVRAG